jgi:hypothetical protein
LPNLYFYVRHDELSKKTISCSGPLKGVADFCRLTRRLLCTQRELVLFTEEKRVDEK